MTEYSLILGIIAFAVFAVLTLVKVSLVQFYLEAAGMITGILEP
ncbi:MAG: hypothetical protein ACYC2T_02180 [Bacillota bacterium]